ncbi:unnamed protein product, partial [Dovyalis caffra]
MLNLIKNLDNLPLKTGGKREAISSKKLPRATNGQASESGEREKRREAPSGKNLNDGSLVKGLEKHLFMVLYSSDTRMGIAHGAERRCLE